VAIVTNMVIFMADCGGDAARSGNAESAGGDGADVRRPCTCRMIDGPYSGCIAFRRGLFAYNANKIY